MNIEKILELSKEKKVIFFGYTTNCGTCKMAEEMLNITVKTLESKHDFEVVKVNLMLSPEIAQHYQLKSTPAFILINDGAVNDKFFAFHSVTHLYEKIKDFLSK